MNNDLTGIIDQNAGRYGGTDQATAESLRQVQQNFRQMRADPILVVAGRLSQPGHYQILELSGQPSTDGVSDVEPDYGMARGDNFIVGVNVFEQATGTWWVDTGTTVVGARRAGNPSNTNTYGADLIFFGIPYNYAGTNLPDGGTGGATNTGGFPYGGGGPPGGGDGSPTSGSPGGSGGTGGDPGGGGGSGPTSPGGGGGSGGTGGGPDGTCAMSYTVVISGSGVGADGTYTVTWDGGSWVDGSVPTAIALNGTAGEWIIEFEGGAAMWINTDDTDCPPTGTYGGPGTCTVS